MAIEDLQTKGDLARFIQQVLNLPPNLQAQLAYLLDAVGTGVPPSGVAGGVLSGTFPNPGFAVDMATQTELDTEATTRATADALKAAIASPTFTGDPKAPTPAVDDSDTSLATTAYVQGQKGTATPIINGTGAAGTSAKWTPIDHVHPTDTSRAAASTAVYDASEQLRMVRGRVDSAGAIVEGAGFSVTKGAAGIYTITYTTAFATPATPTVTLGGTLVAGRVRTSSVGTGSFIVTTYDSAGVATDSGFAFIAVGTP